MEDVRALVREFADLVANSTVDYGRTNKIQHSLNIACAFPIKHRHHRIPYSERPNLQGEVQRFLDVELIQSSGSPCASPIVLVRKKDGNVLMCLDFRKLNMVRKKECLPLRRLEHTQQALAGAK